jgi:hypothetical protein
VLDSFHTCPIPEVARLGRTLRAGVPRSWPTSTPTASATAAPKPSVSVAGGWSGTGWSGWFRSRCLACDSRSHWPVSAVSSG